MHFFIGLPLLIIWQSYPFPTFSWNNIVTLFWYFFVLQFYDQQGYVGLYARKTIMTKSWHLRPFFSNRWWRALGRRWPWNHHTVVRPMWKRREYSCDCLRLATTMFSSGIGSKSVTVDEYCNINRGHFTFCNTLLHVYIQIC